MTYEKIVVGTDGSQTAQTAERIAKTLANTFGAELVTVMAGDPKVAPPTETAEEMSETAKARVRLESGNAAEVLVRVADEEVAGLLVVGNKGMGGGALSLLGNVPNKVSHHAPCDLLIVNTSKIDRPPEYRRLLVATDGSSTADIAVRKTRSLANSLGASLTLISVGPDARKVLSRAIEDHDLMGADTIEEQGDPASKICEVAETRDFDLTVVGNKGMTGSKRFLLGSVPNKVSHYGLGDILIARTTARSVSDLDPNEGGVVLSRGERVAAFRAHDGSLSAISARCTHMGCTVGWNAEEKTWDCPCHGSRYDLHGKVIRGPASKDLAPVDLRTQDMPLR